MHVIAFFIQDFFVFHPEKLSKDFKFKYDLPFDEVFIDGLDGAIIDALYFPVEGSKNVVFYFKGNTRSIKGWAKFAKDFTSKGCSFFLMDYPGFGKSTGKRSEEVIYEHCQKAYDWLKETYSEENIIIYGRSLGAGFATKTAMENNPKMLILDSPFYSFHRLVRYYTRILLPVLFMKYKFPLHEFIIKTDCPVEIIHGNKDWLIPYRYSKEIVQIDPDQITLHTIDGAKHNNLPKHESYHATLSMLLSEKLNK